MPSNTPGTIEGGETAALHGAVVDRAVVRFTQVRDPNATHPVKPEDALTDPIMLREKPRTRQINIFVPNWKELPRMKHGTLRSAYESSMWGEGDNLYQARVYRWTRRDHMPEGARLVKTVHIRNQVGRHDRPRGQIQGQDCREGIHADRGRGLQRDVRNDTEAVDHAVLYQSS